MGLWLSLQFFNMNFPEIIMLNSERKQAHRLTQAHSSDIPCPNLSAKHHLLVVSPNLVRTLFSILELAFIVLSCIFKEEKDKCLFKVFEEEKNLEVLVVLLLS